MDYIVFDRLCKTNGTTPTALALKLGLSKGNTTSWRKGGNPSAEILIKIADELNCTVDTLLGRNITSSYSNDENKLIHFFNQLSTHDRGKIIERAETLVELAAERAAQEAEKISKEMNKGTGKSKLSVAAPAADEEPDQDEEFYIDLCNLPVSAGTGVYLDEGYTEPLQIRRTAIAERANYAVRVSGNSMETKFYDGDIVLVETCPSVEIGEIGIFIVNDEGFIKKRGEDRLISLNPECDDVIIHEYDTVYCRGRVLGKAEIVE